MMEELTEELYPIVFTNNVFGEVNGDLAEVLRNVAGTETPRVLLVADMNVVQHTDGLGTKIGRYIQTHGIDLVASPVVVSGSEKAKGDNLQSAMRVATAAIEARVGVNDIMLVLGGGSMLDIACWAAAQVRGGMRVVRMPTTVAAIVEAAYSPFAALDICGVKDSMRVTSIPDAVVVDTAFATTVLDGVWRAGFAEMVRLAAVSDAEFLKRLAELAVPFRDRDFAAMDEAVRRSVALRREKGPTTFGLWAALRLESMSGYRLPHGYAVAFGVIVDAAYAQLRGLITEEEKNLLRDLLIDCGAMDCAFHSRRLLEQDESLLRGLDAWRLSTGCDAIELPKGLGASTIEEFPDRATMKEAINMLK